ncbi:MAG: Re/Si-specific NAD(P)(+) transhydrogenase subunit alpha [Deltaproteobacteria bacterium]|nr:Re/Si-specific NAD(P)(+) transhydrogenase subunit alpha [Deltaproteobacteria bacterium]MBW2070478.1 Re/Si-specific NAD(P)(+) transhydrogenase subunit alpha [Deltaproteobacteria bacterium]
MIAAVPKETYPGERRVALIPQSISALKKAGLEVAVEAGAGEQAGHADSAYQSQGARIVPERRTLLSEADVVLMVRGPGAHRDFPETDLDCLRKGTILIAFLEPLAEPEMMQILAERGLTVFSMELMPRTTRAQSMDALSSMATIAGYKAVLLAANVLPKIFPMFMTAAGTITPSRVFVLGAGVAGLQAIAAARRLGAVVEGYDIRPEVREQVESLGAKFVQLDLETEAAEGTGGYAAAQSEEFYRRQQELMAQRIQAADVVITTAAVPGKKAPVLISRQVVEGMQPGSVIVDLAAEKGGNCEVTEPGKTVIYKRITVLGPLNLPAEIPVHASQMYAKNISTFLLHLLKEGKVDIDPEDEITAGTLVTHEGKIVHQAVITALGKGD